jgi:hypothetical protein
MPKASLDNTVEPMPLQPVESLPDHQPSVSTLRRLRASIETVSSHEED